MRETLLRVGLDGLLEAVFALAAEDEWKLQKSRLRNVGLEIDEIEKNEPMIRQQIGEMLLIELNEYPATHTRTKSLREWTFQKIVRRLK